MLLQMEASQTDECSAKKRALHTEGAPDGIKVDKPGHIFVTGPKGIWVWDPDGHHLGTIEMPEQPANLT